MPDLLFGPEVKMLLADNDERGMVAFCEALHPARVAEAIEDLDSKPLWRFLSVAPVATQAAIFEYLPHEKQEELATDAGRGSMAQLIEKMSHDDRADLLRRLKPSVSEALLKFVTEADRRDIALLQKYAAGTVGSVMTTDYASIPQNLNVGEALDRIRVQASGSETLYYVYVISEDRRLKGVVTLRDLVLSGRQIPLTELLEMEVISVRADEDREEVVKKLSRYDLLAVPVIDADGKLVGIVTHDDVMDVAMEEATEDAQRMGGMTPLTESYLDASFFKIWRSRIIWLSLLFVAELGTFQVLEHFEDAIKAVVVLSMFIPLCISTGGNSGSQASTLITRAMALGQVTPSLWRKVFFKELLMGLALGLGLGIIAFIRGYFVPDETLWNDETRSAPFEVRVPSGTTLQRNAKGEWIVPKQADQVVTQSTRIPMEVAYTADTLSKRSEQGKDVYSFPAGLVVRTPMVNRWDLAWIISLAVSSICLFGTIVGGMLPLFFRKIGWDPALASGPFVATAVDITGIVLYFSIAASWIPSLK